MSQHWVRPFLDQLTASGNVSQSARLAGVNSTTVYGLRKGDGDFAAAWDQALEDASDDLEAEARRRGVQGVQEPVVYQGQLTPVWQRNADGTPVMESYIVTDADGVETLHKRPLQALDPDGQPLWLTVTKYSDPLLALLLKGRRKKVFADRTELTGADGGELKVVDSTARAARVAHLMAQAAKRKAETEQFSDLA